MPIGVSPGVNAHRSKVQLVFGLKDKRLATNFQDRGRLEGRSYDKQSQLRMRHSAIFCHLVLTMKILQSTVKIQGLWWGNRTAKVPFCSWWWVVTSGHNVDCNCVCINVRECAHACVCVYQEPGGVVEEAAEAATEAPLQEGRVFWWQLLRVVIHDDGDVALLLEA